MKDLSNFIVYGITLRDEMYDGLVVTPTHPLHERDTYEDSASKPKGSLGLSCNSICIIYGEQIHFILIKWISIKLSCIFPPR